MKALIYLLLTTLKNRILSLKKKPIYLVIYGIILVSIIFMFVLAFKIDTNVDIKAFADIRILHSIVFGVAGLFLVLQVITGLSSGSTMFNMADVGLLFVSPISSKKILIYGLIKQMGTTLISAIFIFYQINTLKSSFGLGIAAILALVIVYAIIVFFTQLLAMIIYILTNSNHKKKLFVKSIMYLLGVGIGIGIYYQYIKNGGTIVEALLNFMDLNEVLWIPLLGWSVMFMKGVVVGNILYVVISISLFLITTVAMIYIFTLRDGDYYEDVLSYTELTYNKLQDAKNGKMNSPMRKVKVNETKTGLNGGTGAMAIFYRQLLEKRRSSRFLFIDLYTVISAIGVGLFSYYYKGSAGDYIILVIFIYLQVIFTSFGKFTFELTKPYIYLIPARSRDKIIASALVTLMKPCVDGIILFSIVSIFQKISPLTCFFYALAYIGTSAIMISYTVLCTKLFGGMPNKVISGILSIIMLLVVFIPGATGSIVCGIFLPVSLEFLITLPYTFSCIAFTTLIIVLCGDILVKSEMVGTR
jgi:hypothetical protein